MSNLVEIPFGKDASDTAVLLLAAAIELGLDPEVVGTTAGAFLVPSAVAKKAENPESKPVKKAAAKKVAAKDKE